MFEHPWFLSLLLLLPLMMRRLRLQRKATAVRFSSVAAAASLPPTWRQRLAWIPDALSLCVVVVLIVALARPREGQQRAIVDTEGIAIEMVVDRSGSMQAMDFKIDGEHVNRLEAIKNVAREFILGNESSDDSHGLPGRVSDLVGLITFAGFADAITPPTLDHSFLVGQLGTLQIVRRGPEDGTAIGDAISLAVEKLDRLDDRQENKIKSKIIILLTDGENTAGEFDPLQAAELAQKMGVRIYTIGVGTKGRAPVPFEHPLSNRPVIRWITVNIDEETLQEIAAVTNGKYFRATDTESLQAIYAEIDQLEKTKVEAKQFVDYRELAIQPIHIGQLSVPSLVTLALVLLLARLIFSQLILREFR